MKLKLPEYFIIIALFACFSLSAEETKNPSELRFSREGKFKIVQFTDTHLTDSLEINKGDTNEVKASSALKMQNELFAVMNKILDTEKPDLVIFTGDNVDTPNQTFDAWRKLANPMITRKIPWCAVMGNHDFEHTKKSQSELMAFLETLPCSVAKCGPAELGGGGNYILFVKSSNSPQVKAAIYCLDSGDYADTNISDGYAWFSFQKIEWFRRQAQTLTSADGGIPLPSLAFFHIPFPEYKEAVEARCIAGSKKENVCCPKFNSGMFTAMVESKAIMGVFTGHDHDNDYVAALSNICLAYGRKTGGFGYHHFSGARVIELEENKRSFTTWTRTDSGELENKVQYPGDFNLTKKK